MCVFLSCSVLSAQRSLGAGPWEIKALFGISAVLCNVRPHREDGNWLLSQGYPGI